MAPIMIQYPLGNGRTTVYHTSCNNEISMLYVDVKKSMCVLTMCGDSGTVLNFGFHIDFDHADLSIHVNGMIGRRIHANTKDSMDIDFYTLQKDYHDRLILRQVVGKLGAMDGFGMLRYMLMYVFKDYDVCMLTETRNTRFRSTGELHNFIIDNLYDRFLN
jgi:hypothetical protein